MAPCGMSTDNPPPPAPVLGAARPIPLSQPWQLLPCRPHCPETPSSRTATDSHPADIISPAGTRPHLSPRAGKGRVPVSSNTSWQPPPSPAPASLSTWAALLRSRSFCACSACACPGDGTAGRAASRPSTQSRGAAAGRTRVKGGSAADRKHSVTLTPVIARLTAHCQRPRNPSMTSTWRPDDQCQVRHHAATASRPAQHPQLIRLRLDQSSG